MKSPFKVLLPLVILAGMAAIALNNADQNISAVDDKVKDLLSQMTLEEKVGQMTQVTLTLIIDKNNNYSIDEKKLNEAIVEKKVGSILNVNGHPYSIEQWHKLLSQIQDHATNKSRLGIPILYGIDAIHGANYVTGGTLFPHNIGMAATRNPNLAKKAAKITAMETRAAGLRWNFDPAIGMGRQPLWSRFEETFGEDVRLTSTMGAAVIQGYEERGLDQNTSVASCMKHYIGYSVPLSGKDRTPAYIPDIQLREYFVPPFEAAVAAGSSTVMINSGEINGTPVHGSAYYLKTILRDELGFEGLAVSDWEDIKRLHTRHRIAATPKEAVKIAVNAGIDMSMVPMDYSFFDYLVELVNEGEVSEERIDEAVTRILKLKYELGLFDNPYPEKEAVANFGKAEYQQISKQAALESITLLKNENEVLPLDKTSNVLLAGPTANDVTTLHGSWSYTWQGNDPSYYPQEILTVYEGIANKIGKDHVICRSTKGFDAKSNYDIQALNKDAKSADYIVLCLGEKSYAESPGVIDDLNLDKNQVDLAIAAINTGKPVILLLLQGRPRIVSSFVDGVDGVLLAYRPGNQGANAIADILFGDHSPSGVLPFTYPQFSGDISPYDHKYSERIREDIPDTYQDNGHRPQWPFGHGLSYTDFAYSNLTLNNQVLTPNTQLEVSVEITNSGNRDGAVAVELYTKDLYASITPPFKRLKAFEKVQLKKGEKKTINFIITPEDLSFINPQGDRVTEPGDFELLVGDLMTNFSFAEKAQ